MKIEGFGSRDRRIFALGRIFGFGNDTHLQQDWDDEEGYYCAQVGYGMGFMG